MGTKEPVLLIVFIETAELRWFVAGVTLAGQPIPLIRSTPGNLQPYVRAPLDEQLNFLRHRLSGVLQRGCDRLWARAKKPAQIVFVADREFQSESPELTRRLAEHFTTWMANPPVAFYVSENGFPERAAPKLQMMAGELDDAQLDALNNGLAQLLLARKQDELWEEAPAKNETGMGP